MTYTQFEAKWLGSRVDIDKVYGYQCVDLVKQYILECYGIPNGAYGDAIKWWTNTNSTVLTKFNKVSGSDGLRGDIVVLYGTSGNPYGHIGIATGVKTSTTIEILEQNGSTGGGSGTGGDAIRKRSVARTRVAGLLRPKGDEMFNTREEVVEAYLMLRGVAPSEAELTGWLGQPKQEFFRAAKAEADSTRQWLANLQKEVEVLTIKYSQVSKQVQDLTGQLATANGQVAELTKSNSIKDNEIIRLQAIAGDGSKWQNLKTLIKELFSWT